MRAEIVIAAAVAVVLGGAVFSANRHNTVPEFTGSYADLVATSDDIDRYEPQFKQAARHLIAKDICRSGDFVERGGWTRSKEGRPYFFIFCKERIRLNVLTMDYDSALHQGNAAPSQ